MTTPCSFFQFSLGGPPSLRCHFDAGPSSEDHAVEIKTRDGMLNQHQLVI